MGRLLLAAQLLLILRLSSQDPVIFPTDIEANEGENATFICRPFIPQARPILLTTDPGSTNAQTVEILTDPRVDFTDYVSSNRTFMWLDVNRTEDHLRRFQCDINSERTEMATLRVNFPPEYEPRDSVNAVEGDRNLVVRFKLSSRPDPTYQWTLNGEPIQNSSYRNLTASSVTLSTVRREDNGTYVVTATNSAGSDEASFSLFLTYPPRFNGGSGTVESSFREGEDATLDCSADSNPEAELTITTPQGGASLAADGTYTITDIQVSDAGQYTCTANNSLQVVLLTYNVQIGGLPGRVGDINVTVTRDRVTLTWTAADPNGVDITEYRVRIVLGSKEVFMDTFDATTAEVMRSDFQEATSDSAEYTVTVTAVNGLGDGAPASETFTLPAGSSGSTAAVPTAILSALLMLCLSLIF